MEKHGMKTVKIMICDDDRTMQKILWRKIETLCKEKDMEGISFQIDCCDSGETIPGLSREQTPDILFLDIRMPGRSGMEIAEELRRQQKEIILIFVTALSEYVYEAFDVGAFHYLLKPFGDDKLKEVLNMALQQYERQQEINLLRRAEYSGRTGMGKGAAEEAEEPDGQTQGNGTGEDRDRKMYNPAVILVKRGGISTKVRLADIIYAEVFNRKVMLHTISGDIEYYGKLTTLSEQAGADFYRTHRAYLVNLKYVEKYNSTTIWLERGMALVSKKQFAGFVRQYMQYIGRERER